MRCSRCIQGITLHCTDCQTCTQSVVCRFGVCRTHSLQITDLTKCKPQTLCNIENWRSMCALRNQTFSEDWCKPQTMTQMAQTNGPTRVFNNLSYITKLGESYFDRYIYSCLFVRNNSLKKYVGNRNVSYSICISSFYTNVNNFVS